jgi:hypothetical protein
MKLAESLEAFKKVNSRKEWEKWLENYHHTHICRIEGNFFMDRFSYYDFNRYEDKQASLEQLIAFEEYDEFYVLKDEYC